MSVLYILSNSPGEVSGWMAPVTQEIAALSPGLPVAAVTLPCPYASGREGVHAGTLPGVEKVMGFGQAMKTPRPGGKALVLQLGGDPMYGCALSARLRAPWMIYTSRPKWKGRVDHYFIPDGNAMRRFESAGVAADRYSVVGNLILDSVAQPDGGSFSRICSRYGLECDKLVAFMPGSRPFEYRLGFGFYSECASILRKSFPEWQAVFPVAPTVCEETLREGLAFSGLHWRGEDRVEEVVLDDGYRVPLVRELRHEALAAASLAVAFPGTNNLQIAALGVPLLMIAPLNQAENIPLDGLPGAIPNGSPFLGAAKKRLVFWYNSRRDYVSLPNMLAGRALLPEYRELMTPESASRYIAELMESPKKRGDIRDGYGAIDLRRGAAGRIARKVAELFI